MFSWGGQWVRPQDLCGEHGVVFGQTLRVITRTECSVHWLMGPYIMGGVNWDESVL